VPLRQDLIFIVGLAELNYSRGSTEASAAQAHTEQGIRLAPGMEIGYVVKEDHKWEVDPERTASKFDTGYYRGFAGEGLGRGGVCVSWISQ
jgi:hypothetical protein